MLRIKIRIQGHTVVSPNLCSSPSYITHTPHLDGYCCLEISGKFNSLRIVLENSVFLLRLSFPVPLLPHSQRVRPHVCVLGGSLQQATLGHRLDTLQFNSILTLPLWVCPLPRGEGLSPTRLPRPDACPKSSSSPVLLTAWL